MQDFVSVNPPTLTDWNKSRKANQANEAFKALSFVLGAIVFGGFCVGMFTGWIFWG